MKKHFLLLILCLSTFSFSQVNDSIVTTPNDFPDVIINIEGRSKSEIYLKIKSWINRFYKDPGYVIKVDEPNQHLRVEAASTLEYRFLGKDNIDKYDYTLSIDIKEGRYKVTFSNLIWEKQKLPQYFYKKGGELRTHASYSRVRDGVLKDLNRINNAIFNSVNKEDDKW